MLPIAPRHNSAYVRFHGLIVMEMTLYVVMNRTTAANRVRPATVRRLLGGGYLVALIAGYLVGRLNLATTSVVFASRRARADS